MFHPEKRGSSIKLHVDRTFSGYTFYGGADLPSPPSALVLYHPAPQRTESFFEPYKILWPKHPLTVQTIYYLGFLLYYTGLAFGVADFGAEKGQIR